MKTFVQFIEQRDLTKTYISEQFTVLALYAEYIAWLARQPAEGKEARRRFSASELLIQLELINQYQIKILKPYTFGNETITLTQVPECLTRPSANYLNPRPTEIQLPKEPLPFAIAHVTNEAILDLPSGTKNVITGLIFGAAGFAAAAFYLGYGGLALPHPITLFLMPLAFVAAGSALRGIFDLIGLPPSNHFSNKSIAILAAIGMAAILTTTILPPLIHVPSLAILLIEILSFFSIHLAGDQMVGKIRLAAIYANKAAHEPEIIINTLDQIDQPTLNTSLSDWKQPLMIQLQDKCEQPANKLEEAVTATTHCLLASRATRQGDDTVSIDDLNQNLQKRLTL